MLFVKYKNVWEMCTIKWYLDKQLFSSTFRDSTSMHETLQAFSSSLSTCPASVSLHIKKQISPFLEGLNSGKKRKKKYLMTTSNVACFFHFNTRNQTTACLIHKLFKFKQMCYKQTHKRGRVMGWEKMEAFISSIILAKAWP